MAPTDSKLKLSDPQYEVLRSLPGRFYPKYPPILKLMKLGLVTENPATMSHPMYSITPAGEAQLKLEQDRRVNGKA
jgi:hypothetical protein